MRGESILQADSFHQRKRDQKTVAEEEDRGNRLGSSYTCVCTSEREREKSPETGVKDGERRGAEGGFMGDSFSSGG